MPPMPVARICSPVASMIRWRVRRPRSVILDQVANGVAVRMAVLAAVCNPKGLEKHLGGHRA